MKLQRSILIVILAAALITGMMNSASAAIQTDKGKSSRKPISGSMGTPLPEPWASQVEDFVNRNPWYGGINQDWQERINPEYFRELTSIFKYMPTEDLVPFTEHRVWYIRAFVVSTLQTRITDEREKLKAFYEQGSPRIQFELYTVLHSDYYQTQKDEKTIYDYFNKILDAPNGKIYGSDFQKISNYPYYGQNKSPVDMKRAYLHLLESEFILDRTAAMNALTQFTDDADEIIKALVKFVEKPDERMPSTDPSRTGTSQKAAACEAIGNLGEKAQNAIPVLKKALNDPNLKVRYNASLALYRIGYEKETQVQLFAEQLSVEQSSDELVTLLNCISAADVDVKSMIPKLAELVRSDDMSIHLAAKRAFSKVADNEFLISYYSENLKSLNPEIRLDAVSSLGSYMDDESVNRLMHDTLNDTDMNVRAAACKRLLSNVKDKSTLLPCMIKILSESEKPSTQAGDVLTEISKMGIEAKSAVPALLTYLKKSDNSNNSSVMETIIKIGGTREEIVKYLIQVIKEKDAVASENAIAAVSKMGYKALEAVPAIRNYIDKLPEPKKDEKHDFKLHPYTKSMLGNSLDTIFDSVKPGQKIPVEYLYYMMECDDKDNISKAILMLKGAGESMENIHSHLVELLYNENESVRRAMLYALDDWGSPAVVFIPDILSAAGAAEKKKENTSDFYFAISKIITPLEISDKEYLEYILPLIGTCNTGHELSKKASEKVYLFTGSYDLVAERLLQAFQNSSDQNDYRLMEELKSLGALSYSAIPKLLEVARKNANFNARNALMEIIDSMVKTQDKRVDKDFILSILDVIMSTRKTEIYLDLYYSKGGTTDKLAIRMVEFLDSQDYLTCSMAYSFLSNLGADAKPALPALKEMYQKPNLSIETKRKVQALIETIQMGIEKETKDQDKQH
jgi:HEAT repeat protein